MTPSERSDSPGISDLPPPGWNPESWLTLGEDVAFGCSARPDALAESLSAAAADDLVLIWLQHPTSKRWVQTWIRAGAVLAVQPYAAVVG